MHDSGDIDQRQHRVASTTISALLLAWLDAELHCHWLHRRATGRLAMMRFCWPRPATRLSATDFYLAWRLRKLVKANRQNFMVTLQACKGGFVSRSHRLYQWGAAGPGKIVRSLSSIAPSTGVLEWRARRLTDAVRSITYSSAIIVPRLT